MPNTAVPNDTTRLEDWVGTTLVDRSGEKIGKIADFYTDDETGRPEWIAVNTGLFGSRVSFVPLAGAEASDDDLRVGFTKDQVKDAPNAEREGSLSPNEEVRLYEHYGYEARTTASAPTTATAPTGGRRDGGTGTRGAGSSDDAMTRSEEELDVSKASRRAGAARLRKWVETERVQATVPVTHEEVRVEREPITDANIDRALSGPEITESEHEVELHEEEVVASTRVEPKERVRLQKDTVVEDEEVSADLRRERIEVERQGTGRR